MLSKLDSPSGLLGPVTENNHVVVVFWGQLRVFAAMGVPWKGWDTVGPGHPFWRVVSNKLVCSRPEGLTEPIGNYIIELVQKTVIILGFLRNDATAPCKPVKNTPLGTWCMPDKTPPRTVRQDKQDPPVRLPGPLGC